MNILLRKVLLYISIFSFLLTCSVSYFAGTQPLACLFRASMATLIILMISGFAVKIVFRGIAAHIAECENAKKNKEKESQSAKEHGEEEIGDEENFAESEEKITEELMSSE